MKIIMGMIVLPLRSALKSPSCILSTSRTPAESNKHISTVSHFSMSAFGEFSHTKPFASAFALVLFQTKTSSFILCKRFATAVPKFPKPIKPIKPK